VSMPRSALGAGEQRLISVRLVGAEQVGPDAPTLVASAGADALLAEIAEQSGARLERLLGGGAVLVFAASGAATDHTTGAARAALAVRAARAAAPISLATGRGLLDGPWPVGEAIDRGARLLETAPSQAARGGVRIDDVTAGLLDGRFD